MRNRLDIGRFFPEGAEIVEYCNGAIQIGLYESAGRPHAIAYRGKAKRPSWHIRFGSNERRQEEIENFVRNYERDEAEKIERKARKQELIRKAIESVKVGDIFSASWGYEQTNVDYYQVVGKKGSMVEVREIGMHSVEGSEGMMSDRVVPVKDHFISDEIIKKRIQCCEYDGVPYIAFRGFNNASLDNGSPKYRSWYY